MSKHLKLAGLADQFIVHPNQISEWRQQLHKSAVDVFGSGPREIIATAESYLKDLHTVLGDLRLENDLLKARPPRQDC